MQKKNFKITIIVALFFSFSFFSFLIANNQNSQKEVNLINNAPKVINKELNLDFLKNNPVNDSPNKENNERKGKTIQILEEILFNLKKINLQQSNSNSASTTDFNF
jgi:hypothetical protein